MRTHLTCRSIRSGSWAVKKASSQLEVVCDEHRETIMTLKSSFLPNEPKRRISRFVRVIGPRVHNYVYIGIGAQSEDMNSLKTSKHLPKNPYW